MKHDNVAELDKKAVDNAAVETEKAALEAAIREESLADAIDILKEQRPDLFAAIADKVGEVVIMPAIKEKKKRFFKLTIHEQDNWDENQAVPVGVNGKVWGISRGSEHIVPEEVIGVLKDSVITAYKMEKRVVDGVMKTVLVPRDVPRFAFNYEEVKDVEVVKE